MECRQSYLDLLNTIFFSKSSNMLDAVLSVLYYTNFILIVVLMEFFLLFTDIKSEAKKLYICVDEIKAIVGDVPIC